VAAWLGACHNANPIMAVVMLMRATPAIAGSLGSVNRDMGAPDVIDGFGPQIV
jgi:hypothetical protein